MLVVTPFDSLTQRLIGIGFRVHSELQGGFYERVYENAFCLELLAEGIQFERQKPMAVHYRGQVVGEFVADIVVEGAVLLELKAVLRGLDEEHIAQGIHYLTCLKLPIGLLMNFGKNVQVKRLLNKQLLPAQSV